jgi:hypothetical protein
VSGIDALSDVEGHELSGRGGGGVFGGFLSFCSFASLPLLHIVGDVFAHFTFLCTHLHIFVRLCTFHFHFCIFAFIVLERPFFFGSRRQVQ